jgi:hypothetical protein
MQRCSRARVLDAERFQHVGACDAQILELGLELLVVEQGHANRSVRGQRSREKLLRVLSGWAPIQVIPANLMAGAVGNHLPNVAVAGVFGHAPREGAEEGCQRERGEQAHFLLALVGIPSFSSSTLVARRAWVPAGY